jgi:hypothetical protein
MSHDSVIITPNVEEMPLHTSKKLIRNIFDVKEMPLIPKDESHHILRNVNNASLYVQKVESWLYNFVKWKYQYLISDKYNLQD